MFDFEKMEVYQKSLHSLDLSILIAEQLPRGHKHLSDQLKRAASSVCLNISEGVGEFKPREKARFYRMALRSASESCSVVQICCRMKLIGPRQYQDIYDSFARVSKMLTKLISSVESRV